MKKLFLPVLLICAVLISACGAAAEPAAATAEPTAAPVENSAGSGSSAPVQGIVLDADNPCTPYRFIDRVLGELYPDLPPVTDEDFIAGPKDAPVTFIVYSEPQCPYCALFDAKWNEFATAYPNEVRIIYRFRPFSPEAHDKSVLVSQAMVAAGLQGKFNEFKDWIFLHQNKDLGIPAAANFADADFWGNVAPADMNDWLAQRVPELGIDPDQLLTDMSSDAVIQVVKTATESANSLGITSTPSIFIDGHKFPGSWSEKGFLSLITELVLNKKSQVYSCPKMVIDPAKTYTATLTTTKGDITIDLFDDKAVNAVNSFVFLAREGWYENLVLLSPEEALITGDPSGTGYSGPGYAYLDEIDPELNFNDAGMVALLSSEANRNGSVFFISKKPLTDQGGRTIFGKVTSGLDIVTSIVDGDKLISVTITEK